jgi:hypothetical protein
MDNPHYLTRLPLSRTPPTKKRSNATTEKASPYRSLENTLLKDAYQIYQGRFDALIQVRSDN